MKKKATKRSPVRKVLEGKFLEYRTQEQRQTARAGLDLRWATLAPKTIQLYREAFTNLWLWIGCSPPAVVRDTIAYDMLLADFILHAWSEGYTRAFAGNAVSASIKVFPEVRGRIPEAWYLLNAWTKLEVTCRATPLPPALCLGFIHILIEDDELELAFLLALGFECFLRPGEMQSLRWSDVELPDESSHGIIRLVDTKTSRRTGAPEVLTFRDDVTVGLFRALQLRRPRNQSMDLICFLGSDQDFRRKFSRITALQGAGTWGLRPHSIRRGGATAYFWATGSMTRTIERGRWATTRVARLYVCDGLATGVENKIDPAMAARLKAEALQVRAFLSSMLRIHARWKGSLVS